MLTIGDSARFGRRNFDLSWCRWLGERWGGFHFLLGWLLRCCPVARDGDYHKSADHQQAHADENEPATPAMLVLSAVAGNSRGVERFRVERQRMHG